MDEAVFPQARHSVIPHESGGGQQEDPGCSGGSEGRRDTLGDGHCRVTRQSGLAAN